MSHENRTALILGATGSVGYETMMAFARRGWKLKALTRNIESAKSRLPQAPCDWIEGDAMNRDDVCRAAQGTAIIFHGVNPAGYLNWEKLVLPMLDNTIVAAKQTKARILVPGNVYNFGPDAGALVSEDAPQNPTTVKGQIRVELEERLLHAAWNDGVKSLILRCGDFFGRRSESSWFSQAMVTPDKPVKRVMNPGTAGVGHAFAYLPDVGETFARLADQEAALASFETFHFGGHYDADGTSFVKTIAAEGGQKKPSIMTIPWSVMWVLGLFNPTLMETWKMRQLWQRDLQLDNTKLRSFLGAEPHTPLAEAVRASLAAHGCLDEAEATAYLVHA